MTVIVDTSELQRWGGLMAQEAADVVARVVPAVAEQQGAVESAAQADVPVGKSGRLQGSIRRLGSGLNRRVRAGGARTYYGRFQEFGTKRMPAHPFLLKQANRSTRQEFEGRVGRALDRGPLYR